MSDVAIQQCLYLINHGFSTNDAFSMDDAVRTAFWIILEEQGGRGKYNFEAQKFEGDK